MDTTPLEPGNTAKQAKIFAILVLAASTSIVHADGGKAMYQTLPNSTIRDYRAPAFVAEGDVSYQTLPGSMVRDYRAPAYITKGNTTYQTMPRSIIRDYSAPAYVNKGER